jgi:hypothetical protein
LRKEHEHLGRSQSRRVLVQTQGCINN